MPLASAPPIPRPGSAETGAPTERPLFRADWLRVVFIHYALDPKVLQPLVPFPLHLRENAAFVSLVAFTLENLRLCGCERLSQFLLRPVSNHEFLNVRTYVEVENATGIFFLAEWLSKLLAVPLGPPTFGLPYFHAAIAYEHGLGQLRGEVRGPRGRLQYRAVRPEAADWNLSARGSRDEFLLERYVAFTSWRGWSRFFRVLHDPWPITSICACVDESSLLAATGNWFSHASMVGAHYSPGVRNVFMGRPRLLPSRI